MLRSTHVGSFVLTTAILIANSTCAVARDDFGRDARPESWNQDASLGDIFFLDLNHGWAVGDQGVILRTTNGGADWIELSDAGRDFGLEQGFSEKLRNMRPLTRAHELRPFTCSWHSIHFVDEKNGWVAGSYQSAYVDRQRAIVMNTHDGGATWQMIQGLVLPKIARLHFRDVKNGWAVGRSGNFYKSGMSYTADGGQSWGNQGNRRLGNWSDGDEIENGFVTVDDEGRLGVIRVNEYEPSVVLGKNPGYVRAVRIVDKEIGWAAGSSGTILTTRDGGLSWSVPESVVSEDLARTLFDFSTLCVVGDRIWIAGNPGTYVYTMDVNGGQLQRHRTPITVPITKLFFVSPTHGWATGQLGTIIATTDGGKTWQMQRQADSRIAILGMATDARELPLEIYAAYAGEENVLAGSCLLQSSPSDFATDALTRLGCSVNLTLPGALLDSRPNIGKLVRTIRTLQPSVVVCDSGSLMSRGGQRSDLAAICRRAIESAADRSQFTDQLTEAGLTPWRTSRLLIRSEIKNDHVRQDVVALEGKMFLPRSGQLLEDRIAISRALLGLSVSQGISVSYASESFFSAPPVGNNDAISGLDDRGQVIPRREGNPRIGSLGAIQRTAQKQKLFEQLLSQKASTAADTMAWRRQMQLLGNGQDTDEIGVWLWQLADDYYEKGDFEMAARTLEMLVGRVGNHSLTPAAIIWLAQYYASDELLIPMIERPEKIESNELDEIDQMIQETRPQVITARAEVKEVEINGVTHLIWQPVEDEQNHSDAVANTEQETAKTAALRKSRLELAGKYINVLRQRDPDLAMNEDLRFIEATITRKLEGPAIAENLYRTIVRNETGITPASSAAGRELLIRKIASTSTDASPVAECFRANRRPHLDGKLDDEIWQSAMTSGNVHFKKMTTRNPSEPPRTDFMIFAFDNEFLYIAARCHKIAGQSYLTNDQPRPHDPDLSGRDRIQFAFDLDRDCRSSFRFTVDHRGWVGDNCSGSAGWNPQWFLAADQDEKTWVIECAIPLAEIMIQPADRNAIIAVSTRRLSYDSIDLWCDDTPADDRHALSGLLQSLAISGEKFWLMKFPASPETVSTDEESGEK